MNTKLFFISLLYGAFTSLQADFGTVNLSSSSHTLSTPDNNSSITFNWTTPAESDGWVLNGFYYIMDKNSSTIANGESTVDSTTRTINLDAEGGDGEYYFHIAARGTEGEIGATEHYGPVVIDTTAPIGLSISPSAGTISQTTSVTLVNTSDANSFSIYYTIDGSTPSDQSIHYTAAFNIDSTITVRAIAIDVAGNSSTIVSGTFSFDTDADGVTDENDDYPSDPNRAVSCELGYYEETFNSCVRADAGYYVDTVGSASQTACTIGSYQDETGQSTCKSARIDYYVDSVAAIFDTACPTFKGTSITGSDSLSDCEWKDTDGDGKTDAEEDSNGNLDPYDDDCDGDGTPNFQDDNDQCGNGTNPVLIMYLLN